MNARPYARIVSFSVFMVESDGFDWRKPDGIYHEEHEAIRSQ